MKTIRILLSVLMVVVLSITATGCGGNKEHEDKKTQASDINDDFFTDTENTYSDLKGDAKNQESGKGDTYSTNSDKSVETNASSKNKIIGKSWKDLLASMPKELRGTTIKMFNWNPSSEYTGAPAVIAEFEKQTGIKVEWNTINYDVYTTRLASSIASGKSPDLVRTQTPIATRLVSFQSINSTGFDFSDSAWDQTLMKDYTVNGVPYAISLKNTHLGSVGMMFYNKELINKYNFENPYTLWKNSKWTVNKFLEMCKEYKKVSKKDYGCVGFRFETWSQMHGIQGPIGFDGTKYTSNLGNKDFLLVTQEVADLFNQSKLLAEGRAEVFDAGNCLFYAGASVYARKKNSYFGALKGAGSLYAVPFPAVDGQSKYYQLRQEYEAYAIAKGAKNAKSVPYFLRYFLDGGNYDLSSFLCNKQNLEIYNWCMSQKNNIWAISYESNEDDFADRGTGIYSKQGNQIKSFIDSNSSVIDRRVNQINDNLKNLSK